MPRSIGHWISRSPRIVITSSVGAIFTIEHWLRRHGNGWTAEVSRDEEGHCWAAAHGHGRGGTFNRLSTLESAQDVAESRIPRHTCSDWTCGPWIRNGAGGESITAGHTILVQASFSKIDPHTDAAGALFYRRLFEIDPTLRLLFSGDLFDQGRKLMAMVERAVSGLDELNELLTVLQALGVRHARYGVQATHYDSFSAALLWTLGQELGADFTPEVKNAWLAVCSLLATVMKEASAAVE